MNLAPIIVFGYNRPMHLRSCLVHLSKNTLAGQSKVFIFCDGPKSTSDIEEHDLLKEVREVVQVDYGFSSKEVITRNQNYGLAKSVISGISQVLESYDKVIVLEDDILTGIHFLEFMNKGLDLYYKEERVFGLSGYCYPSEKQINKSSYFLPIACSWSYGVWKRSWDRINFDADELLRQLEKQSLTKKFNFGNYDFLGMLKDCSKKKNDSWAIRFYASMFLNDGFFLYPMESLAQNIGFDRSGVHCGKDGYFSAVGLSDERVELQSESVTLIPELVAGVEASFRSRNKTQPKKISKTNLKKQVKKVLKKVFKPSITNVNAGVDTAINEDDTRFVYGQLLSKQNEVNKPVYDLKQVEFQVFSQWGDDGIIDYLTRYLTVPKTFIEFGVEDYMESNTRFLMMNQNWSGLVMDGDAGNIAKIKKSPFFWKYELIAKAAFITAENINELIKDAGFEGLIGLLHIDIDGNDYWIWKAITVVQPVIVVVEYNSVFGQERAITVPYIPDFFRTNAHYSNLYAGASLPALVDLADDKGYVFIGCNQAGNNAYFVHKDHKADLQPKSISDGFVESKFRESRDSTGNLTFLSKAERIKEIQGLDVFNTRNMEIEKL